MEDHSGDVAAMQNAMERLPGVVGTLTLGSNGNVVSSTGELSEDPQELSGTILGLLRDTRKVLTNGDKTEPFKRLSVVFDKSQFVITVAHNHVYVVKKTA